jgi:lipopolysaccharide/colanic/teichoic acid biosynthesis glycosyltransferase
MSSLLETLGRTAPAEPAVLEVPEAPPVPAWYGPAKRVLDVTIATVGLVLTAPLLILAVAGIALVARERPFYRQERVGLGGRPFWMFKLRTMVGDADQRLDEVRHLNECDGPVFKIRRDPRLHCLGPILRRTSIDELPNLINVLAGDMAIVGPRPPLPSEVEHYEPSALRRLVVKPGVTCLWQISGRSHLSFEQWMALDNAYIDSWSPFGDIAIILRTIPAVIRGTGAH